MAWAVQFASEFGKFFPCGDYPDLQERLQTYFFQEMPAEERDIFRAEPTYSLWVFDKFTNEIGVPRLNKKTILTAPRDHEWPEVFQADYPIQALGSLLKMTDRILAVDERMKDVIEAVEPGKHQFRPITFLQPSSDPFPGSYFTMIIGQFRDSFAPEETRQNLWRAGMYRDQNDNQVATGTYSCLAVSEESFAGLGFSRSAIDGAHLWRERLLLGPDFFISDTLRDAIKQAGLEIPLHFSVKEVA